MQTLRNMVEPNNMRRLYELASKAAAAQVTPDDFPAEFDNVWSPASRDA